MTIVYIMLCSVMYSIHAFNPYIYRTINPSFLRRSIQEDLTKNFNKISWVKAKQILHSEANNMDIYGDNLHTKNVEHIFPQVYFKNNEKKNIMKSDMHNLQLCSEKLNSYRQHFKFIDPVDLQDFNENELSSFNIINSDCKSISNINSLLSQKHDVVMINRKKKLFVPSEKARGSISRSLAYFSVKYNYTKELENVIDMNTLIKWNHLYPVDANEYHKNVVCFKHHNVLNPFILYPELINYCFIDLANMDIEANNIDNSLYTTNELVKEIKDKDFCINKLLKSVKK